VNFLKNKIFQLDRTILLLILTLIGVGIVLVFSSSFIFAIESRADGFFYFKKQILFALVGMCALLFTALMPFEWIRRYGFMAWIVFGVMVLLTFIPHIGVKSNGAIRWIYMGGGVYLEPSEFLKVSLPLVMAYLMTRFENSQNKMKAFFISCLFFFPLPLLLKQNDFGSFTVCVSVLSSLLFIFGLRLFWVISGASFASVSFYFLVMQVPYRKARIMAFLDPWSAIQTGGYQVIQSLLSFYSGGVLGSGLGQGQGKLYFLPEAHTDFIFSVLGEEAGFFGVACLFLLYGFLIIRSFQIAARIRDVKAQMMATGFCLLFTIQVLINLGVVFGLLPTKGLALPFLSYGGSSMVASCILFGLLLNIQRTYLPVRAN
jgi:cell division protein FtsW